MPDDRRGRGWRILLPVTTSVTAVLADAIVIAALAAAVWSLVMLFLPRPVGKTYLLGTAALIELAVLVLVVAALIALAGPHGHLQVGVFVGYLVALALILPAAVAWSLAEPSRWGVGVLLVALLVIPVMIVRLDQIWSPHG